MQTWQLQDAKAKLTEFVNRAKSEPQIISRRGRPEIIALSIELYQDLTSSKQNIVSFFKNSPLGEYEIVIERDQSLSRNLEL